MRQAIIYVNGIKAGFLEELVYKTSYSFTYDESYNGHPVSLTMPLKQSKYEFNCFPCFLEGLLPEGMMLEVLLKKMKIDRDDMFTQLLILGEDMVGAITARELKG